MSGNFHDFPVDWVSCAAQNPGDNISPLEWPYAESESAIFRQIHAMLLVLKVILHKYNLNINIKTIIITIVIIAIIVIIVLITIIIIVIFIYIYNCYNIYI